MKYPPDNNGIIRQSWCPEQKNQDYQMCVSCIMDTTDPWISFDENGTCNHCLYAENSCKPHWFPNEEGQKRLEKILAEVKAYGKGKKYDCIIGLSGGVDSSYVTVKSVEWGLRPLVVHVDAGWNSELAVKNIEQIIGKCGLDLVTHVIDWEEMRDMQLAFLKSNLANADVPQDHAFFAALYNYAISAKIRYVINGSNFATESILPQSWGYDAMDIKHLKSIHNQFGSRKLKKFPYVGFYKFYFFYPRILQMKIVAPLNYIKYSKKHAIEFLEKEYGWRYYGGKHYESRWTRFFQAHYLPHKFGYDKRKAHLSSLVVAGEITKDEALEEMKKPLYDENQLMDDKIFVAKKLAITVDELEAIINQPPRFYTDFPNNQAKLKWFYEKVNQHAKVINFSEGIIRRIIA